MSKKHTHARGAVPNSIVDVAGSLVFVRRGGGGGEGGGDRIWNTLAAHLLPRGDAAPCFREPCLSGVSCHEAAHVVDASLAQVVPPAMRRRMWWARALPKLCLLP